MTIEKNNTTYTISGNPTNDVSISYNGEAVVNSENKIESVNIHYNYRGIYNGYGSVRFNDGSTYYNIQCDDQYSDVSYNELKNVVYELNKIINPTE